VEVTLYRARNIPPEDTHPFSLLILDDGHETVHRGVVRQGSPWRTTFDYRGSR